MEKIFLDIINKIRDGVYFVDNDRKILFWNKAAEEITGYTAEEIIGKNCPDTKLNHIDEGGRPLCLVGCPLFATVGDGETRSARVFARHKEGYRVPLLVNIFPMKKDGEVIGAIEIFTKDSPTVYEDNLVEKLSNVAMHDQLTKLPNRRYLESFLEYKMEEYIRFGRKFAVLFADIDNFSKFNNEYGHDMGDTVLKNIAQSIMGNVRRNDLVGRWGGEEYVGIFSIYKDQDVELLGERFRSLMSSTEVMNGNEAMTVTVSVGISMVKEGDTLESIVTRADNLMYKSKADGKDRVTVG